MKVITVGCMKGGVGKSTLSTNLAVVAKKAGLRVLLVDADPQKSVLAWSVGRESNDIPAIGQATVKITSALPSMADAYDLAIVDCGGRDSQVFRAALAAANLVVVPVLPSYFDVVATTETLSAINELKIFKPDVEAVIVINQVISGRSSMLKDAFDGLAEVAPEFRVLDTKISRKETYKKAAADGKGVADLSMWSDETKEMEALFDELMTILLGDNEV